LDMVGRKDARRTVRDLPQDDHPSLRDATGTGRKLSGVHQGAVQIDRAVAAGPCHGVSPADDRDDGRGLEGGEVGGVRGRWQPRGRASHPRRPAVVFVSLAVAILPVVKLALADAQPADELPSRNRRSLVPTAHVIDHFVAGVMGNPTSVPSSPACFFARTFSSINSEMTSFFCWSLFSRRAIVSSWAENSRNAGVQVARSEFLLFTRPVAIITPVAGGTAARA
jgi:hypothetical protein